MTGFVVAALIQWLSLGALAAWVGAIVLDRLILPRARTTLPAMTRGFRSWDALLIAVLLVTSLAQLAARAHTMAGGDVGTALAAVPTVLTRTHFGAIWIVRLALLAVAAALTFLPSSDARSIELLLALAVAFTTSMAGHAGDRGDLSVRVIVDWLHVVSVGAWAGGLLGLAAIAHRCGTDWSPDDVARTACRFSRLAGAALVGVVASGTYATWVQLPGVAALWTTAYGRVLDAKLLVVLALVALGGLNRWGVVPRLDARGGARGLGYRVFRVARAAFGRRGARRRPPLARFTSYVGREAVLVVAVLAITGVLTESTPPRHAGHESHRVAEEERATPFRVTMEELHEEGGVPPGWTFRPALGDPERGRTIFRRLACFGCHRVAGEDFPPPWHAGPELTDMGAHHPAGYLAESVMNPNAVIVEGPGFTGPDGRSTMPDYSATLSVADLDDLVAYLKTL